jgi:uncharacterized membrane protein
MVILIVSIILMAAGLLLFSLFLIWRTNEYPLYAVPLFFVVYGLLVLGLYYEEKKEQREYLKNKVSNGIRTK